MRHYILLCGYVAKISKLDFALINTRLFDWAIEKLCLELASPQSLAHGSAYLQLENIIIIMKESVKSENADFFMNNRYV